ncbi:DUF192 domain-containing protein [Wenzhouxiangella sp. XN79A]|uniref:DUF192 domain-containing protein n=1 Tax=Wenzhouxiangella sp. XN79A TaxID=2724193 RepID=UPI00144A8C93|nr:DUF192 domain-containing protein [Wenzhouxiangella sp. XN79A]NKI36500.1 DUF192 domain-containing protein [Wenzhouxiangella sp. XN79A]
MIERGFAWPVALLALLLTAGCQADGPWVEVAGKRYQVEIADDDASRARGLMFVDSMADDAGMLFLWRNAEPRAFWMRNTRIPLDILYIGADRTIVSWSLDTPPCRTRRCPSYPSGKPAKYVLEVNGGQMETLGAKIGDPVVFGNVPGEADG